MRESAIITVEFLGTTLWARPAATRDTALVGMKPLVEGMGLSWAPQHAKLREHPVLGPTITLSMMVGDDGRVREAVTLPLTKLPFWLATIQTARIPDATVRERIITFQQRVCDVLEEALFGVRPVEPSESADEIAAGVPWVSQPVARMEMHIRVAQFIATHDGGPAGLSYLYDVAGVPRAPEGLRNLARQERFSWPPNQRATATGEGEVH